MTHEIRRVWKDPDDPTGRRDIRGPWEPCPICPPATPPPLPPVEDVSERMAQARRDMEGIVVTSFVGLDASPAAEAAVMQRMAKTWHACARGFRARNLHAAAAAVAAAAVDLTAAADTLGDQGGAS